MVRGGANGGQTFTTAELQGAKDSAVIAAATLATAAAATTQEDKVGAEAAIVSQLHARLRQSLRNIAGVHGAKNVLSQQFAAATTAAAAEISKLEKTVQHKDRLYSELHTVIRQKNAAMRDAADVADAKISKLERTVQKKDRIIAELDSLLRQNNTAIGDAAAAADTTADVADACSPVHVEHEAVARTYAAESLAVPNIATAAAPGALNAEQARDSTLAGVVQSLEACAAAVTPATAEKPDPVDPVCPPLGTRASRFADAPSAYAKRCWRVASGDDEAGPRRVKQRTSARSSTSTPPSSVPPSPSPPPPVTPSPPMSSVTPSLVPLPLSLDTTTPVDSAQAAAEAAAAAFPTTEDSPIVMFFTGGEG